MPTRTTTKPTKSTKSREPAPIDPFNAGLIGVMLSEVVDRISLVSLGIKPSDRRKLMEGITRMAIVLRKSPESPEAREEYNRMLDEYERDYQWLHDIHKNDGE